MATGWVYVFGETNGADVKIGYTARSTIQSRLIEVNDQWNGTRRYAVLAGVRGTKGDEKAMRAVFRLRNDLGNRKEYVWPDDMVVEYVNWLRAQWYVSADGTDPDVGFPTVDPSHWLPGRDRTRSRPVGDPEKLVQDYDTRSDHLGGTAWSWMVNPCASIQDYFTPAELIAAAGKAMGGIDLDAASHWMANRVHRIPDFFDVNRSAFDNRWHGRVWLNPPYGDNAPWFREILRYVGTGDVEQLCMISPIWSFTTMIARPVMEMSSAFVLLNPTPQFWGNAAGRTGTNKPHGILYVGQRSEAFFESFALFGYPMSFKWDIWDDVMARPGAAVAA